MLVSSTLWTFLKDFKMAEVFQHLFAVLCLSSITQSSVVPTDGSQTNACNTCCQGPSGLPGIPGAAGIPGTAGAAGIPGSIGNNGIPGRDGTKGESGSKGDIGESGEIGMRGPPGPQGPSGDRGERGSPGLQGVSGKVGPIGLQGLAGRDGNPGPSGEPGLKGDKGEMGESRGHRSAFSVVKTSSQIGNPNDVLTFQFEETNIGGHFNLASSTFTCQIPGTYVFMFTIGTNQDVHDPYVDLVKDGVLIARVLVRETDASGSEFLQGSQSMVVQLTEGNAVWLKFASSGKRVYSDIYKYTTFSGFLLYED